MTSKTPKTVTVSLSEPVTQAEAQITDLTLRRPTAGDLRGINLAFLQMQKTDEVVKLLSRITTPALAPDTVERMDGLDLVACANAVSGFFVTPAQLAAIQAAMG
ncbi:MAG: phage tail assembly protein [Rhodobacteraceae bacterium]|nr:phage tail assembly protein [Paracoccaceae bacterium]